MRLPRRDRGGPVAPGGSFAVAPAWQPVARAGRGGAPGQVARAVGGRRCAHRLVVLLGLGLALWGPRRATGHERTQVALAIDDCVAVDRAQVRHLLSLELGGPLCEGEIPAGATRAAVTCPHPAAADPTRAEDRQPPLPSPPPAAGDVVELRVDDAVTGKSLWRSIELHQTDAGVRARLLSLALSELLFAGWAELLVTPEPAVPAAAPAASAATRQATSVQVERKLPRPLPPLGVQLSGLAAAHMQLGEPSLALGGGVRVTSDHRYHLGWDLDLLLHHGESATSLGTVTRDLVSARATLLVHQRVPYLTLRAGLGGRLGAARLSGAAAAPKTVLGAAVWGPWGGPLLAVGLSAAAARVRLDLSVEAGYVIAPVAARVGGVRAVAIEGSWMGIQIGLGGLLH